jgi:hypothetical protein
MIWNLIGTIGGKVLDIGAANVTERSESQYTSGQLVYYFSSKNCPNGLPLSCHFIFSKKNDLAISC